MYLLFELPFLPVWLAITAAFIGCLIHFFAGLAMCYIAKKYNPSPLVAGCIILFVGGAIGFVASYLFLPLLCQRASIDAEGAHFFASILGPLFLIVGHTLGLEKKMS